MTSSGLRYILSLIYLVCLVGPQASSAFPIYAQQIYENPREANGRIVCANCHLGQGSLEAEVQKTVLPNSVFESILKIKSLDSKQQILENGKKASLNIGAIMILPENFRLAPSNLLDEKLRLKLKSTYIIPYSSTRENILVVGPVSVEKTSSLIFPILTPEPSKNNNIFFGKYPIYVGVNRGRGQIYPNGEKTNNNAAIAATSGRIDSINQTNSGYEIQYLQSDLTKRLQSVSKGLDLIIKEGDIVREGQEITLNPNVGGFGQEELEIILQDPHRIYGYGIFCTLIFITQIIFVLKKKQFEKVQKQQYIV